MGQFTGVSSVRRVVFSIIGVLCLFLAGLSANVAVYAWQKLRATDRVVTGIVLDNRLLALSGQLAVERDMVHVALVAPDPAQDLTHEALGAVRRNIDEHWSQLIPTLDENHGVANTTELRNAYQDYLGLREAAEAAIEKPKADGTRISYANGPLG